MKNSAPITPFQPGMLYRNVMIKILKNKIIDKLPEIE